MMRLQHGLQPSISRLCLSSRHIPLARNRDALIGRKSGSGMAVCCPSIGQNQPQESPPNYLHLLRKSSYKEGCEHVSSASFEDLLPLLEVSNPSDVPLALAATRRLAKLASNDPSAPFIMLSKQPDLYKTLSRLALSGVTDLFLASMDALVELDVALSCGGEPGGSFLSFYSSSPEGLIDQILMYCPQDFTSSQLMEYDQLDDVFLKVLNQRLSPGLPYTQTTFFSSLFHLIKRKPYLLMKAVGLDSLNEAAPALRLRFKSDEESPMKNVMAELMKIKGINDGSLFWAQEYLTIGTRDEYGRMQLRIHLLWLSMAVMSEEDWDYIRGLNDSQMNTLAQCKAVLERSLIPLLRRMRKEGETSKVQSFALESLKKVMSLSMFSVSQPD